MTGKFIKSQKTNHKIQINIKSQFNKYQNISKGGPRTITKFPLQDHIQVWDLLIGSLEFI